MDKWEEIRYELRGLAEEYDYVADDLAFDADREKRFFG
jgi:hypothetical protein